MAGMEVIYKSMLYYSRFQRRADMEIDLPIQQTGETTCPLRNE